MLITFILLVMKWDGQLNIVRRLEPGVLGIDTFLWKCWVEVSRLLVVCALFSAMLGDEEIVTCMN